ncbi:energy-coupling factor ABC transporter ATP-binding protein [Alistipes sp.]|uniref:energy-coupling factor ABC transporter ATP-binding protein n=1 Tax=Alistipes sp. TaxID=1872444 RepID=UPI003AF0401B
MSHHYLRFNDVHYRYPNGFEALGGVSLCITHGEKVALVGANGAGKSTLLLHTNGLLMPSSGEVVVGGITLTRKTVNLVRQSVGLVFQDPDNQLFMPTVEEDVAFGPSNMGLTAGEIESRVVEALEAVGALGLRKQSPYHLSGGQKKSVSIATVLSMGPSILVLDEPTANLDPRARRQTIELLGRFSHTMLVATHDMELVWELCPRTLAMQGGRIVADGTTRSVFNDTELLEACGLERPCRMEQPGQRSCRSSGR